MFQLRSNFYEDRRDTLGNDLIAIREKTKILRKISPQPIVSSGNFQIRCGAMELPEPLLATYGGTENALISDCEPDFGKSLEHQFSQCRSIQVTAPTLVTQFDPIPIVQLAIKS